MTNHLTSILLSTENAAIYPLTFLIDSGSELNLIKSNKLTNKVKISSGQVHSFSGIISLGTCKLSLRGVKSNLKFNQNFQVVGEDFKLEVDGILGQQFFREFEVSINFKSECLNLKINDKLDAIPLFSFSEVLNIQGKYKNPNGFKRLMPPVKQNESSLESLVSINSEPFVLRARSQNVIALTCFASTDSVCLGYEIASGIYLANSIFKPYVGFAQVLIVNTTSDDVKIEGIKLKLVPLNEFIAYKKVPPKNRNRKNLIKEILTSNNLNHKELHVMNKIIHKFNESFFLLLDLELCNLNTLNETPFEDISVSNLCNSIQMLLRKVAKNSKYIWQTFIDLRKFNFTMFESMPLIDIYDIFKKLGDDMYISTLSQVKGFQEISPELEPKEIKSDFDILLSGIDPILQLLYFDKIVLSSPSLSCHSDELSKVFELLSNNNIKLNPQKVVFFAKACPQLGHKAQNQTMGSFFAKIDLK